MNYWWLTGIVALIVILPPLILSAIDGFGGGLPLRRDGFGSVRPYAPPPAPPGTPAPPRPQR